MSNLIETKCRCGHTITVIPRLSHLPCNTYCCGGCCPYRKVHPCPKDEEDDKDGEGGLIGMLKLQQGEET